MNLAVNTRLTSLSDLYIFQPFVNLPNRKLVEYYKIIKEPLSLTQVWKKVKGMTGGRGKEASTNQTEFRTWDAFENEFRRVWENARTYNEEGSEIDEISHELEVCCMVDLDQSDC